MQPIIEVNRLSKLYCLETKRRTTFQETFGRWCDRLTGNDVSKDVPLDAHARWGELEPGPKPHSFWALKDISFEVSKGEILGIIGNNGAGKSTLLKVLSRVSAPTSGSGRICGRASLLTRLGSEFHPELTGRENIYLSGAILGMRRRKIARKFKDILEFSGIEDFIDIPVKRYSSGMYLRLAFSVVAHLESEILFIDEALSAGDAEFQKKSLEKMCSLAGLGRTILIVSHNLEALERLCTRIIYLRGGKIQKDGPPAQIVREYLKSIQQTSSAKLVL